MHDALKESERTKYETMWAHASYRMVSPGAAIAPLFLSFFQKELALDDTLTDFGAGTGAASIYFALHGLRVEMVDIAANALDEGCQNLMALLPSQLRFRQACLWELPDALIPSDWIYCADVLEHLPETHVDAALDQMQARMVKGGFFQICLCDESFGELIGQQLHLTIHPKEWWLEKIEARWKVALIGPDRGGSHLTTFLLPRGEI